MSLTRSIVQYLDRPGGRYILGKIATRFARWRQGSDIEIFYDGLWNHRVGSYYFPDGRKFNYYSNAFPHWQKQTKEYLSNAKEYWFRHYSPKNGDVIIDVGAGRGEDTLAFSQAVGESGRVIAVEAHPLSFEILENFCRWNRLTNTVPLHIAVMDKPGYVSLVESDVWYANNVDQRKRHSGIEVRATTLDDVCKSHGVNNVAFLKMNIEGAERYALFGMQSAVQYVHTICVACHDFMAHRGEGEHYRTRTLVEQFLTRNGFKLFSHRNDPRDYIRDHIFGVR